MADDFVRMHFKAVKFAKARNDLQQMRERAANVSPAWEALLDWWAARNMTHWRSKGQRWRTPWKPLAPSTIAEKLRLGYPTDILRRTDKLRNSLTRRPLGIERIRPHEMEAGTAVPYAHFHQDGTRRMPARKIVNAAQVQREGVSSNAVINWIVSGKKSTRSNKIERSQ